jgi:hypothetical protein
VSIDDLRVVERTVFNDPANRLAFPVPGYDANCYFATPVATVFNPAAATPGTPAMPFFTDFSGRPTAWTLANARVDRETGDATNKSLILARSVRGGNPGALCSVASILVGGLTPGKEYVIDFSWFVGGISSEPEAVLDVVVDDNPAPPTGPWRTNAPGVPSGARSRRARGN